MTYRPKYLYSLEVNFTSVGKKCVHDVNVFYEWNKAVSSVRNAQDIYDVNRNLGQLG